LLPKTRDGAGADPIFVGGTDYHLDATDTWARDQGADLSGDAGLPFSDDIDGETRSGSWDIGSDEAASLPSGPIYYSVGTDSAALYTGNASASFGTLTLAGPAANNVGVGDEIRQGANRYYITGRNSSTEFTIQNSAANGGTPGATNITFGSTPITIYRAFLTLSAAESGAADSSHLNSSDLVAGTCSSCWPLQRRAMNDGAIVVTDGRQAANYLRIFTLTAAAKSAPLSATMGPPEAASVWCPR
jgi:hypothetical protein